MTRSASLPTSIEPTRSAIPACLAGLMVIGEREYWIVDPVLHSFSAKVKAGIYEDLVLDLFRKMLRKLLLRHTAHIPLFIKQDTAVAGGPRIQCHYVFCHTVPP